MATELVAALREQVRTLQNRSGVAQALLSGTVATRHGPKTIDIGSVMTVLLSMRDTLNEAIELIQAEARAAGAQERRVRGASWR